MSGCAVVTGGASGIGAATAVALRSAGHKVVIIDRRLAAACEIANRISAEAFELDIGAEADVRAVIETVESCVAPIDILVNCAGPLQNTDRPEDLTMRVWDRIVDIHLRGTYLVSVEVGRRMALRRGGSIVTVASVMGMRSGPLHAYGPAKAALINLNEGLAAEWGPANVRVNTVSPGFVTTPGLERGLEEHVMNRQRLEKSAALGRTVTPAEVASAICFLASSAASGITGCNLPVDAGYLVAGSWEAYGGLRVPREMEDRPAIPPCEQRTLPETRQ